MSKLCRPLYAGRYNFSVLAGNEARPEWEFGTASAISNQLIVGARSRSSCETRCTLYLHLACLWRLRCEMRLPSDDSVLI